MYNLSKSNINLLSFKFGKQRINCSNFFYLTCIAKTDANLILNQISLDTVNFKTIKNG